MKYPVEFPTKLIIPNPDAEKERQRNEDLNLNVEVSDVKSTSPALAVIDLTRVTGFSQNISILSGFEDQELTLVELDGGETAWSFYLSYEDFKLIYNYYLGHGSKSIVRVMNFKELLNNIKDAKDSSESSN